MRRSPLPSVVLVGRPNVGKSTLFNRLTGRRRAIVTPVPGTTRDVIANPADWRGYRFEVVDTGGMFGASEDPLHQLVLERGRRALDDADLVLVVMDGREGLAPGDRDVAAAVRKANKPAILVVNKSDDRRSRSGAMELYQLGFEPVLEVSAEHGDGTGDLLDAVVERLPRRARESHADGGSPATEEAPRSPEARARPDGEVSVAVVGRPNAGKSSLVNRLLREERMIVNEMPGTTRDSVDAVMTWHRRQFRIVDTAGIRRPGRVARSGQIESVSVLLARRAMESADVVVLVIDAAAGPADQDGAIAGEAEEAGCGIVIAANKWDLVKEQGPGLAAGFDEVLRSQLKFLDYAPIVHVSAVTGERTPRLIETVDKVVAARHARVATAELNAFLQKATAAHPPPSTGRSETRILYGVQASVAPPTFVLFTNNATKFHFSYERFLVNRLREAFGFVGTPIRLQVRRRRARQRR